MYTSKFKPGGGSRPRRSNRKLKLHYYVSQTALLRSASVFVGYPSPYRYIGIKTLELDAGKIFNRKGLSIKVLIPFDLRVWGFIARCFYRDVGSGLGQEESRDGFRTHPQLP
jgi:hypothetical protein